MTEFKNIKGKTVLVTGGLGFIGGHFIELLLERGFSVVNIDKITYASNPALSDYFEKIAPGRYSFIKQDINNLSELPYSNYIVHFAAESHVDNSILDSDPFIKSNILGTQNLLNLLKNSRGVNFLHTWRTTIPRFVYIGTDEVFGDIAEGYFKETDRYNPSNPYSASKASAEMLVMAYGRTYGIPYAITRSTNNYGERQHPEKFVPHCISRILSGEKIRIHGSGEQIRNWIHARDNCEAIYRVMLADNPSGIYHISSPEEYSVNNIAKMLLDHFGKPFDQSTVEYVQDRSGQDVRYALDSSKIKEHFDWQAERSFKTAVADLANFYEKKQKGNSAF